MGHYLDRGLGLPCLKAWQKEGISLANEESQEIHWEKYKEKYTGRDGVPLCKKTLGMHDALSGRVSLK